MSTTCEALYQAEPGLAVGTGNITKTRRVTKERGSVPHPNSGGVRGGRQGLPEVRPNGDQRLTGEESGEGY